MTESAFYSRRPRSPNLQVVHQGNQSRTCWRLVNTDGELVAITESPLSAEPICFGVLKAMAIGLPVILPPTFEPTFKAAAQYAEPSEVWTVIVALWKDETKWKAQAQAGLEFVRANSHFSLLADRLRAH